MSEYINNVSLRKEKLKSVLQSLHAGQPITTIQAEFGELARQASSEEIAEAEQLLIEDGVAVEEIQQLCDLHVAVFREGLDRQTSPESIPGHPVHTFHLENEVLGRYLDEMGSTLEQYQDREDGLSVQTLRHQLAGLQDFDRHYRRKENLLFPFLERVGIQGPSKVMWGIHNEIRGMWKGMGALLNDTDRDPDRLSKVFACLQQAMRDMVYKEEKILLPTAVQKLVEEDWVSIRDQEHEIGYFLVVPGSKWHPIAGHVPEPASRKEETLPPALSPVPGQVPLHTGSLTTEQIDLVFRHLPVDVTFVDETDTVRYFSQTRERIFERTEAIIGRQVQNCHPPQSVGRVQRILDDFRRGSRDSAEFWIQLGPKFINIRYFALRDELGKYRGTLEVSQDLTALRSLQGERRLLDD
jgi:DUF438 domain-containing protein